MKDNQGRDLEATKKWLELEARLHREGVARAEKVKIVFAEWVDFEGVTVLRIESDKHVAAPVSGRKNSRKFDIINVETREFVCQVSKERVHEWLQRARRD